MIRAAAVLLAVALASSASAQVSNNQIAYAAIVKAPPGSWADYRITKEDAEEPVRVRYTLVTRDEHHVVLEVDSQTALGRVVMRMEFTPAPGERARWNLTAAKMKTPEGQVQQMPIPAQHEAKSASFGKGDSFGTRVGRESVTVPAGKFSAEHYKQGGADGAAEVWIDDKVLPVGMVRLDDGSGGRVELMAVGRGGKGVL
jgi:hypothetical protein